MKKLVISSFLLVCLSALTFSQIEEKMKSEGVVSGVVYKDGNEIQGYIRKTGTAWANGKSFDAPWEFQDGIKFIPKDVFETTEKIKGKMYESIEPKDYSGFRYEGQIYESVKYADMSAVGMGMMGKQMFMRRISEDKITIFHYFSLPPSVVGSEGFEPYYTECGTPQVVYRIGKDGKLKLVNDMNIEKELADCPMVVEKQQKGEYKVLGQDGESSGGGKLLNNALFREQVRMLAIEDYNKNCK
jgi:hypothetical protein